jgi:hypothetical protein
MICIRCGDFLRREYTQERKNHERDKRGDRRMDGFGDPPHADKRGGCCCSPSFQVHSSWRREKEEKEKKRQAGKEADGLPTLVLCWRRFTHCVATYSARIWMLRGCHGRNSCCQQFCQLLGKKLVQIRRSTPCGSRMPTATERLGELREIERAIWRAA